MITFPLLNLQVLKCEFFSEFMKITGVFLFLLFNVSLFGQTQLNNSGFEQWEGTGNALKPVRWNTMNTADGAYSWAADKGQVEPSTDVRPHSLGKQSIRIYSRSILGVVANGNITTGRVRASSMKATNPENSNSTRTKEKGFFHTFSGKPDSMTVWVKNNGIDPVQNAYIHAIIHDEFDYSEPPTPECEPHLVGDALLRFQRCSWTRKSVAFDYSKQKAKTPKYILIAVGTNQIAGKGDKKDEIFLDDFLMIYNPKISVLPIAKTTYSKNETIEIAFTLSGTMSPNNLNAPKNQVTAQLSDKNGNFDHPTILGRVQTDTSGIVKGKIPSTIPAGTKYRIRVVTTNYPMVSKDNGVDISINFEL